MDWITIGVALLLFLGVALFVGSIVWLETLRPLRWLWQSKLERERDHLNGRGKRSSAARSALEARAEALGESVAHRWRLLRDPDTAQLWRVDHVDIGHGSSDLYHPISTQEAAALLQEPGAKSG